MTTNATDYSVALCAAALLMTMGCTSLRAPATADVAVSKAAVANAAGAGGVEFAPVEMSAAREKLARANACHSTQFIMHESRASSQGL
jgi:hypothetical protein